MIESNKNQSALTIGRLAKLVGVNVETIRYYQRIGLIDEPATPLNGFRKYSLQTAEHITFIKRAQRLGFSLKEIAESLEIPADVFDQLMTQVSSMLEKGES